MAIKVKWIQVKSELPSIGIADKESIIEVNDDIANNYIRGNFAVQYQEKEKIEVKTDKSKKRGK